MKPIYKLLPEVKTRQLTYMLLLRCLMLLLCFSAPALADDAQNAHIQSAFTFAKRGDWNNAILHAKASHNAVLTKYFIWEYLKDPQSGADFNSIADFIDNNPGWPDLATLQKRAEVALLADNPSPKTLSDWFSAHPPLTFMAKRKLIKDPEMLRAVIREAWVNDDYEKATEAKILEQYRNLLRPEDHIRRIDRLIWEGKFDDAKRLLKYVPYGNQLLFQARMSLAEDKQRAPVDVVNVPPQLKNDPGLLYERLRWRVRGGDRDGARDLLLAAPHDVPYPEKWWGMRDYQVRTAIGEGDIRLAVRLLANHGQKKGTTSYREVQWLVGWLELEFLNQPQKAFNNFSDLFDAAQTPAGKAQAAYWAARAAKADGDTPEAKGWLSKASKFPTTFYGQVAMWEANSAARFTVPEETVPTAEDKAHFKRRELVQLVIALADAHQSDKAGRFIMYLEENAPTDGEAVLAVHLGREINRIDFAVRASKKALLKNVITLRNGWPLISTVTTQDVEKALVLGLMRQESEFYADAVSGSGAVGLMQLLPGTAKEIARKSHFSYSYDRLFDPGYNMRVGSIYMGKMVNHFDGSYVLSIASYNAGPGRVRQWEDSIGQPGHDVHSALDWIEKIPTAETRNYVEHVLENVQVYRLLLAGGKPQKLTIEEDLTY
jgi:soluble lytic murein transglycosylase